MFEHLSLTALGAAAIGIATADNGSDHEALVLARFGALALSEGGQLIGGNLFETGRARMKGLDPREFTRDLSKAGAAAKALNAAVWPAPEAPAGELSPSLPAAVG